MIKDYLQNINGVEIYPIISLIVFVIFFAAIIIWLVKVDKKYINKMENLPFEKNEESNINRKGELNEKKV
jgi:cytochrome c oxidase cbb3-type subunit 4